MPSLEEMYKDVDDLKVLIYGPPGTGKTMFAGSFPTDMLYIDWDITGSRTLMGKWDMKLDKIVKRNLPSGIQVERFIPNQVARPKTATDAGIAQGEFTRCYNLILALIGTCPYKTIVVDSLGPLSSTCLNEILAKNKYTPGEPEQGKNAMQFYQTHKFRMEDFFDKLRSIKANIVLIAHEELEKDELTSKIMTNLLCDGRKFGASVWGKFDEIYHAEVVISKVDVPGGNGRKEDKLNYVIRTKPDGKVFCRTRLHGLDPIEKPDYSYLVSKARGGA